ncbi:TPA: hypothetical protein ACP422_003288 [Klebsiella pneumoniae]
MMFLMFSAPCAAVITKQTIRKTMTAMKKPMTELNVISAVSKVLTPTALTTAVRITPMSDITELAHSLKRRATSANEFGESLYVKGADVIALVEALEKAQQRISQLESRTVTVNLASRRLPSDYVDGEFGNDDLAAIHNACRLECKVSVEKYLSAHGIVVKWEAE